MSKNKLKIGFYWAASCGGCEIAILEIGDKILDLAEAADIVFWPCLADFKVEQVHGYEDGSIDLCLFNGAIRTSEQLELAQLLRQKSKLLIAYGSCAHEGCIPGLANLYSKKELIERVFVEGPSTNNPDRVLPCTKSVVDGHELELPAFWETVQTLGDVVDVDYTVPGCPPTEKMTWAVLEAVLEGELPARGSIVGAGDKSVCDECRYEKREEPITEFRRPHLFRPNDDQCLLEQGLVCMGPATRSGCEARCLQASQPCRGCYGPIGEVTDQGAKMIAALGSSIGGKSEDDIRAILDEIVDPAGTFYRFGMAKSQLRRKKLSSGGE